MPIALMVVLFIAFLVANGAFFTVKQQSMAVLERLGRFTSIRGPGLHFKMPFIDKVAGKMSLKVRQLDVNVETKTKDNVFVKLKVGVQYVVGEDSVYDAFYKLANPDEQINSYIFDVVRAEVPKMNRAQGRHRQRHQVRTSGSDGELRLQHRSRPGNRH